MPTGFQLFAFCTTKITLCSVYNIPQSYRTMSVNLALQAHAHATLLGNVVHNGAVIPDIQAQRNEVHRCAVRYLAMPEGQHPAAVEAVRKYVAASQQGQGQGHALSTALLKSVTGAIATQLKSSGVNPSAAAIDLLMNGSKVQFYDTLKSLALKLSKDDVQKLIALLQAELADGSTTGNKLSMLTGQLNTAISNCAPCALCAPCAKM